MRFFLLLSILIAGAGLLGLCGCQPDNVQLAQMMQDKDPNMRLQAIDLPEIIPTRPWFLIWWTG